MKIQTQVIPLSNPGTVRSIKSFHFTGKKSDGSTAERSVYLQGSLHADEWPPSLVLNQLIKELETLERDGKLRADFTVVPFCNPIGLDQNLSHLQMGRFDLDSGKNFNRDFPNWNEKLFNSVKASLGNDQKENTRLIRKALDQLLNEWTPKTELEASKKVLFSLSLHCDFVFDMHCDYEAVLHLYTQEEFWPNLQKIAAAIGSKTQLIGAASGDNPFDEATTGHWIYLQKQKGSDQVALGCQGATIEYRGQNDVSLPLAQDDAKKLCVGFAHLGLIDGTMNPLPELQYPATPLAGSEDIKAPYAGLVSFQKNLGDYVKAGEIVCDLIDPVMNTTIAISAKHSGVLYARDWRRYCLANATLAKVASSEAFKTGSLLSAK